MALNWWRKNVSLHLRNADPQDTIDLMAIDVKSYDKAWLMDDWRAIAHNPRQNVICVTDNLKPVAFMAYELDGAQLKILRLAVLPSRRRQGLGRSMLVWVERLLKDRRMQRATCIVPITNIVACKFLRACGYKVPAKGGIVPKAFDDCGEAVEGLYFIKEI
jgi:ribosomal protein S18 acetylase RimI-like enzyme